MKRRSFMKSIGALTGGLSLSLASTPFLSSESFQAACENMPPDQKFWNLVRQQFLLPADYFYFNTGGLGSSPLVVIDTVKKKMDEDDTHPTPSRAENDWWRFREQCAKLLGPGVKKEEIALTGTTTEGINIILNGLPLKKGDEIITTTHEHPSLIGPLVNKVKTIGIVVKTFEPDLVEGEKNVERIERLITKKTRLIFISHVTCTTGQVMPVEAIGRLAKSRKILFALDGAQAVAHKPFNLPDTEVDFYTASGHKWLLGPKRTGILYVREELVDFLHPHTIGTFSTGEIDLGSNRVEFAKGASRYEYGTQNQALFYGLKAAVDFMTSIGLETAWNHNRELSESFYREMQKIPGVEIISPSREADRSTIITFRKKGVPGLNLISYLMGKNIRPRHVNESNLDAIRISFHIYNSMQEMERLLKETRDFPAI